MTTPPEEQEKGNGHRLVAVTDRAFMFINCACADPFLFPAEGYNTADTDKMTSSHFKLIALRNSLQFTSGRSL